ncbi:flagellar hook-length control protein FliK, partial [Pelomonas sp. HMWF004]
MRILKRFFRPSAAQLPSAAKPSAMPMLMALEPRIMFDAALAGTAVEVAQAAVDTPHDAAAAAHADSDVALMPAATEAAAAQPAREVVFLSGKVDDAATLAAGLRPGVELVMLDSSSDGLAQIANYLGEHSGISAVHIVSHGREGSVELGNFWLSSGNMAAHADALASIGQALAPGGDLLFYGCNLSAGQAGAAFLDKLAQATGADVAASDDPTGSAMFGGDW